MMNTRGLPLNALEESLSDINTRTFKLFKGQGSNQALFRSISTIVCFCALIIANIAILSYWGMISFNNMEDVKDLLESINLHRIGSALYEKRLLVSFLIIQSAVYLGTVLSVFGMQWMYPKRVFFAKKAANMIGMLTVVGCMSVLAMVLLSTVLEKIPLEQRGLFSLVFGLISAPVGYWLSKQVTNHHIPLDASNLDMDGPYVQRQRENGVIFEDIYTSERRKYVSTGRKAEKDSLAKFDQAIKEKKTGESAIKKYMPIILSMWAVFITMPLSALAFFINDRTVFLAADIIALLGNVCRNSSPLTYAVILASIISGVNAYGIFIQIVSFFLGSMVGESRCGHGFIDSLGNSVRKTMLESIQITSDAFYSIVDSAIAFLCTMFVDIPGIIVAYVYQRKYTFSAAPIIRVFTSLLFMVFGSLAGITKTFMCFKMGMYPLGYIQVGDRNDFFTSEASTYSSLYIGLSIFMIMTMLIIGFLVFMSFFDRYISTGARLQKYTIKGRSLRFWAISMQILCTAVFVIIPSIVHSFTARSQLIIDLALQDITWHAPKPISE
ncbi:hypothetical protein NEAUS04_0755 [Nematocida ausubeli]|uniref:Uncharacterized protein n=1 Tax=Nematocida ausubeli (strain ATCC PRA-371 / ERTm2) TaxID=1913371 RepID=A0A086J499_NEMA1|nr:uncharacterized protein NESG_00037 [Nematocida ausubeli]KAI5133592.1 hypothetical protein NEAUS07_0486 [Nematocida ausubeli]KAI5147235.1 hypothetical protein NEAUS05_0554 [Nematocida ausubeli]KAI5160701.1 hypothetical protein NEAUS04_0098 [Nematocida ausubeli]KAI5161870.1 hypothetical protein NEAUS04_0755 [Nematocida ausubeli]KFG26967.1 hypothetical protein NESG_00037 [Nematocida ausubeli]